MKKMFLAALTALTLLAVPNTAKAEVQDLSSYLSNASAFGDFKYDTGTKTLTITDQKGGPQLPSGWDVEHVVWKGTPTEFGVPGTYGAKTSETHLFPRHRCCTSRVSGTISLLWDL